ncbi:MAG TPA: LUD domain-containing protein [Membranihabitans sp.]|nr:LUD domain-containing protein [Membranihabitans sp.]
MSSRDRILQSVRQNLPTPTDLPEQAKPVVEDFRDDRADKFAMRLEAIGGLARFFSSREEAIAELANLDNAMTVRDFVHHTGIQANDKEPDITVLEARWAVAENGAVFISDKEISDRSSLFLGHKLIALVPFHRLVSNMHEAYNRINLASVGFGIFIAGPSATADIAQILVRGAHGPAQMEVWLYHSDEVIS